MITNIENAWGDDENNQVQGGGANSFGIPDNGNTTNRNSADDFSDEETEDDDLLETDIDLDDEVDEDADYDEDNLDDTEGGGTTATGSSGSANSPDETPEERESDNEGTGYSTQTELNQPQEGADTSYSEQNDVTPPNPHEFPSVGAATKTDFASRPQGRTTGRMVGHEPGTEGI
jgi:hypothetical protein